MTKPLKLKKKKKR